MPVPLEDTIKMMTVEISKFFDLRISSNRRYLGLFTWNKGTDVGEHPLKRLGVGNEPLTVVITLAARVLDDHDRRTLEPDSCQAPKAAIVEVEVLDDTDLDLRKDRMIYVMLVAVVVANEIVHLLDVVEIEAEQHPDADVNGL